MIELMRVKMINLFRKHRSLFAAGAFLILALGIFLAISVQGRIFQKLSTPALIDQALARGEITDEERLLYLAYAIFEYESLPSRFRGNVGWRGTSVVAELYESAQTPSILCSMSPSVRSEFQRLLNLDTTCE
jgi:hypothetical protein